MKSRKANFKFSMIKSLSNKRLSYRDKSRKHPTSHSIRLNLWAALNSIAWQKRNVRLRNLSSIRPSPSQGRWLWSSRPIQLRLNRLSKLCSRLRESRLFRRHRRPDRIPMASMSRMITLSVQSKPTSSTLKEAKPFSQHKLMTSTWQLRRSLTSLVTSPLTRMNSALQQTQWV